MPWLNPAFRAHLYLLVWILAPCFFSYVFTTILGCALLTTYSVSGTVQIVSIILKRFCQMGKERLREVRSLAQEHTASQ